MSLSHFHFPTSRLALHLSLLALLIPIAASAGTRSSTVVCYGEVADQQDPNADYADLLTDRTTSGSAPDVVVAGASYKNTSGDQEGWCYWTVPQDYDSNSNSVPTLSVIGYARDCLICLLGVTCTPDRHVEFEVSARVYQGGDPILSAYGAIDSVDFSYAYSACGSPCATYCWKADEVQIGTADITDDASNLAPGDFVIIRLLRDNDISNNLGAYFMVPAALNVDYPTP